MATLSPCLTSVRDDAGLYRELDVLERLQDSLPDGFEIFHSVSWHLLQEQGGDRHGEIDLVVLSPAGNVLLMEVKAGDVILRNGDVFKLYRGKEHDVARQVRVQYSAMLNRLREANLHPYVTNCLVLPDYQIGVGKIVAIPRERIIDATDFDTLGTRVRELLSMGQGKSDVESVRRFLANEFNVSVNLQVLGEQVQRTTRRLADGLAVWVPRIASPSGVMRIQATAGSGKTQLALRLLSDGAVHEQHALYVCFNRTLADHISLIAPASAKASSFHELCVEYFRRTCGEPDFTAVDVFQMLATKYCESANSFVARYDTIIIDEGQDFQPEWVASLLPQLKPSGRLYLMEDDAQRVYEREAFDLSEAVTITSNENFRTPRAVCDVINALRLADSSIVGRSPYQGELPGFRTYESERDLKRQTAQAVADLVARGIDLSRIAVLSARGRAKSVLLNINQIGKFTTRRFTGNYSADGVALWVDGDLLVESVYRFKGQSAAGVVLSEVDFSELSDTERRKLFVGMTRAELAVEIVLSKAAEACFANILGA